MTTSAHTDTATLTAVAAALSSGRDVASSSEKAAFAALAARDKRAAGVTAEAVRKTAICGGGALFPAQWQGHAITKAALASRAEAVCRGLRLRPGAAPYLAALALLVAQRSWHEAYYSAGPNGRGVPAAAAAEYEKEIERVSARLKKAVRRF